MHDSAHHAGAEVDTQVEQIGYSVERAAGLLDLSRRQVFYLIEQEDRDPGTGIESVKIGRSRRIPRQALVDYMQRLRDEQTSAAVS